MIELTQWLASLPVGQTLRQISWITPWLQTLHIIANAMLLSSVLMIDLRIWGFSQSQTVAERARRFHPWIWANLLLLTVTGVLLMTVTPRRTLLDITFQTKMALTGIAVLATIVLQIALRPNAIAWDGKSVGRALASTLATAAFVLWVGATLAGRGRWLGLMLSR
jgi:uncharacterized membrane protein